MSVKKQRVFFFEQVITKSLLLGHIDKKQVYIWYIYKDLNFRLSREKQEKKMETKRLYFHTATNTPFLLHTVVGIFLVLKNRFFFLQNENKTAQKKELGKQIPVFTDPFSVKKCY